MRARSPHIYHPSHRRRRARAPNRLPRPPSPPPRTRFVLTPLLLTTPFPSPISPPPLPAFGVNKNVLIGFGGDMSDSQAIERMIQRETIRDRCWDDGRVMSSREVYSLLSRIMYQRRSKNDPLWNELLIAGVDDYADVSGMQRTQPVGIDAGGCKVADGAAAADGASASAAGASAPRKPFLGRVDKLGMSYEEDFIATGFGLHLAVPLMRERWTPDMTLADARSLLEDCMRVLYYRDCRTINRIQFATVVADAAAPGGSKLDISEPYALPTKWDYAQFIAPKAGTDTGGSW